MERPRYVHPHRYWPWIGYRLENLDFFSFLELAHSLIRGNLDYVNGILAGLANSMSYLLPMPVQIRPLCIVANTGLHARIG